MFYKFKTASGDSLKVLGKSRIQLRIAKQVLEHEFLIVANLNRNGILGRDFLVQNNSRLYFDLSLIRVNQNYQALESDIHIASIVRSVHAVSLPPYTMRLIRGRTQSTKVGDYTIREMTEGHLFDRPGISVIDCIGHKNKQDNIPILMANETGEHYRIRAGAKIGHIEQAHILSIKESVSPAKQGPLNIEELVVEDQYKEAIWDLINENRDVFAANNNELGYCRTLPVKIELNEFLLLDWGLTSL